MRADPSTSEAGGRLSALLLAVVAIAAGLLLLAAPVLAADGVRVIPSSAPWPAGHQFAPDVANQIVVFSDYTALTADPPMWADMKYLGDDSVPIHLDASAGSATMQFHPRAFVDDAQGDNILDPLDTIYAVWTRMSGPVDNSDTDIMIWKGSFNPVGDVWTPASGYPKVLVSGPAPVVAAVPTQQRNPAIGATDVGGSPGIVVAWEDTRDNGVWAPQIYILNLRAEAVDDPGWDPATAGVMLDNTDLLARGQTAPEVGAGGVFWLDERWSFWNAGELKDTAIWRADLSSGGVADVFWWDDDHTYDNGEWGSGALVATANGAAWLRKGPYGADVPRPFAKAAGGSGAVLTSLDYTFLLDAFSGFATTRTVYALQSPHGVLGTDSDISFYDTNTHVRTPICNRTGPAGEYLYDNTWPAVGPGPGLARVVWADSRNTTTPPTVEEYDARLYQAFVPSVVFTIRDASILRGSRFRFLTTVAPEFSGTPVYLQRLTRTKQQGALTYVPVKGASIKATLNANSSASWSWKPPAKGAFYFRVWFPGAAKYDADGVGTSGKYTVPHVPNSSKIIKVVVK